MIKFKNGNVLEVTVDADEIDEMFAHSYRQAFFLTKRGDIIFMPHPYIRSVKTKKKIHYAC